MNRKFWLLFILLLAFPFPALADMGPKPEIVIRLKNPPKEEYLLDLLIHKPKNWTDRSSGLPEGLAKVLRLYQDGDWVSGTCYNPTPPLFTDVQGFEGENGLRIHRFGYFGTPREYRVIIVTEGEVKVSEVFTRKTFTQNLILDGQNMKAKIFVDFSKIAFKFLITLVGTLFIEGIVLCLFRYPWKENRKIFFMVNLLTQIILYLVFIFRGMNIFSFIIMEILILFFESVVYGVLLKGKKKGWGLLYGICANLLSMTVGIYFAPLWISM